MRALLAVVVLVGCASRTPRTVDAAVVFAKRGGENETVEGRVHCASTREGELACAITHEGDRGYTVCFHVEITCRNGNRANAEACREITPGTETRTLHSAEGCDAIDEGRVTDAWIVDR